FHALRLPFSDLEQAICCPPGNMSTNPGLSACVFDSLMASPIYGNREVVPRGKLQYTRGPCRGNLSEQVGVNKIEITVCGTEIAWGNEVSRIESVESLYTKLDAVRLFVWHLEPLVQPKVEIGISW